MFPIAAYCINLDSRVDRWENFNKNRATKGVPETFVKRWSAIADQDFGALGCAKSHYLVLSDFLLFRTEPYVLIFEDDFEFIRDWGEFASGFNSMLSENPIWDVLLLSGTYTIGYAESPVGFTKILESSSASGYIVSRKYVPELISIFASSIEKLDKFKSQPDHRPWINRFAIDSKWKQLQSRDRWYIFTPPIGKQSPSYSDIEKRDVDYTSVGFMGM